MPYTGPMKLVHIVADFLLLLGFGLLCLACSEGEEEVIDLVHTDKILVASFNIQTFGESKLANPQVLAALVDTVHNFDLVAVQEIRGAKDYVLRRFVSQLNKGGYTYQYASSPLMGDTTYLEQYAFIFNASKVHVVEDGLESYGGPSPFARPPFMARFTTLAGFDFVLINIHTKPDDATAEIAALAEVVEYARERYPSEADFIVLGDFNADCSYFDEDDDSNPLRAPEFTWAIDNSQDTNVAKADCTYDRIVFVEEHTGEDYTGNYGVFRFDLELGLSTQFSFEVSDHFPVWAQFFTTADTD